MQLIAEAYDLLRRGSGLAPAEIADDLRRVEHGRPRVLPHRDHRRGAAPGRRQDRQAARRRDPRPGRAEGHRRAGPCRPRSTSASRSPASPRPSSPAALSGHAAQRAAAREVLARRRTPATSPRTRDAFIEDVRAGALRLEGRRLRAGLRPDRRRRRASTAGTSTSATIATHLARRLHHPRPVPQPHHRGLRRGRRTWPPCSPTPYFADAVADGADGVAPGRRAAAARPASRRRRSRRRSPTTTGCARAPARRAHPGPARLLRRAHLQARRQRGHVPHPLGGAGASARSRPRSDLAQLADGEPHGSRRADQCPEGADPVGAVEPTHERRPRRRPGPRPAGRGSGAATAAVVPTASSAAGQREPGACRSRLLDDGPRRAPARAADRSRPRRVRSGASAASWASAQDAAGTSPSAG